jgi:hypothetical protein
MINVLGKHCRENKNILCSLFFLVHAVYEIIWKNTVESRAGHR